MRPDQAQPVAERIRSRIEITADGCWHWTGAISARNGYGRITVGSRSAGSRRTDAAHRVSYEEFVGPIPDGLHLDHLCRNRDCVNPEHLEPVTCCENLKRGVGTLGARNAEKTHCPAGHEYTESNTYRRRGMRHCVTCRLERDRMRNRKEPLWP